MRSSNNVYNLWLCSISASTYLCTPNFPENLNFKQTADPFAHQSYEEDGWTAITSFLDGKSLVMLGIASKWFYHLVLDESIWKFACLRDLQVPEPKETSLKWSQLYISAFGGSHAYTFRQQEKHIDLQLVRCPVCDLNSCEGTMQVLDARHIELFLNKGYQEGSWDYELIGSHDIQKSVDGASGAIYDIKHLQDPSTSAIFKLSSWVGKAEDWQPKAMITFHAVAVNTNLQKNDGRATAMP